MWKSQPGKWFLWAPLTVGPAFLASLLITTSPFLQQIGVEAKANLSKVGGDWARLELDGRDSVLFGDAPDESMAAAAVQAVSSTSGIRVVDNKTRVVPPPPPPPPPAVVEPPAIGAAQVENGILTALGSWNGATAKTLTIRVGDQTFSYPGAPEISVAGNNWTLKLTKPLPPGSYGITAEASDGVNPPVTAATSRSVVIEPPPPAPIPEATMATPAAGAAWPFDLNGTWPEGEGRKLAVTLAGKSWQLGATPGLQSNGQGAWTLKPDVALTPGTYDVKIDVTGSDGVAKTTNFPGIIKIEAPKPEVPAVAAPVVNPPPVLSSLPATVTGLWSEAPDRLLQASVDGKNYLLRKAPELTSDGKGSWSLQIAPDVPDGAHKLVVQTLDAAGAPVGPAAEQAFEVNARPPAAPTVASITSEGPVTELNGTWAEGDANQLSVEISNTPISASLGAAGSPLTSDGKGNWTLKLSEPLKPGSYDVIVRSTDAAGQTSADLGTAEITVKEAPAPQPVAPVAQAEQQPAEPQQATAATEAKPVEQPAAEPTQPATEPTQPATEPTQPATEPTQPAAEPAQPAAEPAKVEPEPSQAAASAPVPSPTKQSLCEAELARLQEESPLRFDFNHDGLPLATQPALKSYAAAMLGENCAGLSFNVAGNSDRWGSEIYNQQLSDARAKVIARELSKLGVQPDRMTVKGLSEKQPVATEDNLEAWRRNRRVDITVSK